MPRIGILGGTFDPPHKGHIAIAMAAMKECDLQKIIFMPAKYPPHKPADRVTSEKDRMNMLELAVGGHAEFEVSDIELRKDAISYTVETLREVKKGYHGAEIIFIIGADNISEMESWYKPDEILEIATVVAFNRPGFKAGGKYKSKIRLLNMLPVDISSTEIRSKVRANENIENLVPGPVRGYIEKNSLYRDK
ncbi:MAG: nicotinate-nucleotide adenylyltransferase [Candidatus Zixiibacteriota bacterium]|nr:MAG: nicotinate-nucleotide adenylyltransferase [candidate division Zixibacteria bacterium]